MVDRPDFAKAYLVAQPETSRRPVGPVFDSQSTVSADQTHLNHDVHLASTSEIARTDLRGYKHPGKGEHIHAGRARDPSQIKKGSRSRPHTRLSRKPLLSGRKPTPGFEPGTPSLRVKCSTS